MCWGSVHDRQAAQPMEKRCGVRGGGAQPQEGRGRALRGLSPGARAEVRVRAGFGAASRPSPRLSSSRSARPRAAIRRAPPRVIQPLLVPPQPLYPPHAVCPGSYPCARARARASWAGPAPLAPAARTALCTVNVRIRGTPKLKLFPTFPLAKSIE